MKIFDQPFVSSPLLPQEKKVEADTSSASGTAGVVADSSNVERDSNVVNDRAFKYPAASPDEINAKNRRADAAVANNLSSDESDLDTAESRRSNLRNPFRNNGTRRPPSTPTTTTPTTTTTPFKSKTKPSTTTTPATTTPKPKPTTTTGGSNSPSGQVNTAQSIVNQPQSLPPAPPSVAANVRDNFISAGINNLVGSVFTVGNQFASSHFQTKLTEHSEMPGAPVVKADGTIGTVDPAATEAQKMDARIKGAEIKNEATSNLFIYLSLGPDAKAVEPSGDAPTDTEGRLTNLESTQNEIENQMPELAERFEIVYKRYVAPASSEAPTEQSRMDNIEKRQAHIDKKMELLKTIQDQKAG